MDKRARIGSTTETVTANEGWDTRLGSIALDLPRLRKGSYFPEWLLSSRRRAERTLVQVVSESYVNGVSTRRVDRLAAAMGIEGISSGVELIVSDDHKGLKGALAKVFVGAGWQRCRTHFDRNLLAKVPKAAQDFVAALNRSIFAQPNAKQVWEQHRRVVDQLTDRFEDAAQLLEDAAEDILAFSSYPKAHWRQIWSNNPQERLNREIRRRTDVVSIFPNREAILRLVGAVLAEQNDEWCCSRRYMSLESFKSMHKRNTKEVESVKSLAA